MLERQLQLFTHQLPDAPGFHLDRRAPTADQAKQVIGRALGARACRTVTGTRPSASGSPMCRLCGGSSCSCDAYG